MLSSLIIKNILLVDEIELEFKKGLNTLTGETGAGKSVLIDCLGFVLGWNNSTQLVREGKQTGEVIAEFNITSNHDVSVILEESGIANSETIILRRMITKSDGRKRNFINDKSVSLDLIKRLSKNLVELQDQSGNQILLDNHSHIVFLDRYANLASFLEEIQDLWKEKQRIKKELETEIESYKSAELEKEYLDFAIEEINSFDIQKGEEEKLDIKRRQVRSIEREKEKLEKIDKLMSAPELDNNITDMINLLESTRQSLGDVVDIPISGLDQTLNEFSNARLEISRLLENQNFDTDELEKIEERLFKLRGLARKYNVKTDQLPNLLENMRDKIESLNSYQNNISNLQKQLNILELSYNTLANNISDRRVEAAQALDRSVIKELTYLKMADCLFNTDILRIPGGARGVDRVTFKVVTNQGNEFGKLQAVSSGGEMSRFLLALKVCLTNQNQGTTMIFDEIDRGIGGATADSVGRRLSMLAKHSQIIVVTHSPQVAAHGDHQWKVEKLRSEEDLPITQIKELNLQDRLTEIARMLAGKEISEEALAAAKKLLG